MGHNEKEHELSAIILELSKHDHLINLISSEVSDALDEKLVSRETRFLKIFGVIAALIAFLGYQGVHEMITSAANNAVESSLKKQMQVLEPSILIATLSYVVESATRNDGFSEAEKEQMVSSLEKVSVLKRNGSDIANNPAFINLLEKIIDAMAASDNDIFVDKAFELFPEECIKSSGIVQTLLQHYGQQAVVGVGEAKIQAIKNFGLAEKASQTNKVPEISLAHRILIDFKENELKVSNRLNDYMQLAYNYNEEDRDRIAKIWLRYAKESWVKRSTPESKALKRVAITLLVAYKNQLLEIMPEIDEITKDET